MVFLLRFQINVIFIELEVQILKGLLFSELPVLDLAGTILVHIEYIYNTFLVVACNQCNN